LPDADAADLLLLVDAARTAGALALSYFGADPRQWKKGESSLVSEADIAVDRLLHARLTSARADYGWLSEETADTPERLGKRRLFVVDPIDGTRAFLGGSPEWTVALAVVEDGRPTVGVVFAPVPGDLYAARLGGGARRNDAPIRASAAEHPARARAAGAKAPLEVRVPAFGEMVPRIPSLALRMTRVAEGTIDAAFAAAGSHDWDLAAADLLVHEAGGRLTDITGVSPTYNRAATRQPSLVAAAPLLHRNVIDAFARHGGRSERDKPR
jgi:myo-inositol-1(or 4)-monophosphatase